MDGASEPLHGFAGPCMTLKVAAVIPARNEAEHIAQVVRGLWQFPEIVRVLVVDDGSTDVTAQEALRAGAQVIRTNEQAVPPDSIDAKPGPAPGCAWGSKGGHRETREQAVPPDSIAGGKGQAIRAGLDALRSESFDYYLFLDGDGQHDPQDFRGFLDALAHDAAFDFLLGTRHGDASRIPRNRWITNRLGSWALSRIAGVKWLDSQCGFRMIRKTLLDQMCLKSKGFEIEMEILLGAARHAIQWTHVPIKAIYHPGCPSHFQGVKDVLRIMLFSLRC